VAITSHIRHLSLPEYAAVGDGHSYLDYARLIGGERKTLEPGDVRLFPGLPALLALIHLTTVPLWAAALGITWLSAGIIAAAGAHLFHSRVVGWALVFLIPDYVLITSVASTEGPMLALTILGLLFATRGKRTASVITAGLLLGAACVIRPMACFAVLGFAIYSLTILKPIRGIGVGIIASICVALAMIGMQLLWGDAFIGAKSYATDAYHGQLFTWPFGSIIMTPLKTSVPILKIALVWAHIILALGACAMLALRAISSRREPLDWLSLPWLVSLVFFNLCVGDIWGFQCFARFLVPALPALFDAIKPYLPKRVTTALALGAASFGVALISFTRRH
jgi:hypothetical protein